MPAVVELSKERIVKVAVKMVNDKGWESVNARSLAKHSEYQPNHYTEFITIWMK